MNDPGKPAAGWYPTEGRLRWWDGERWTEQYAPLETAPKGRDPANDGTASFGYIMAILFPVIGFILGVVLTAKNDNRGVNVILLSVLAAVVWVALLSQA